MKTALLSVECKQLRCTGGITWSHVLSSSNFDRCWVSLPSSSFSCSAQNVNLLVTTPLAMLLISGWPGGHGLCIIWKKSVELFSSAFWWPLQAIWKRNESCGIFGRYSNFTKVSVPHNYYHTTYCRSLAKRRSEQTLSLSLSLTKP